MAGVRCPRAVVWLLSGLALIMLWRTTRNDTASTATTATVTAPPVVAAPPAAVIASHPRLYLTVERLATLRQRAAEGTPEWRRFIDAYNGVTTARMRYAQDRAVPSSEFIPQLALAYQVSGDPGYAEAAVAALMELAHEDLNPKGSFTKMGNLAETMVEVAIGFDWLYDQLSPPQRRAVIEQINKYMPLEMEDMRYPWHNRGLAHMLAIGLCGYATAGDNPNAPPLIAHARKERFDKLLEGMNRLFGAGGGWVEGDFYGFVSIPRILQYVEAVRTATGEDLYTASPWFKDRLAYRLSFNYPGTFYDDRHGMGRVYDGTFGNGQGKPYFGYFTTGDGHRGMSGMTDGGRLEALMLINRFPEEPAARQLQWLLARPPHDHMLYAGRNEWLDFLWFNPAQPEEPPSLLAHAAAGVGVVTMRSDWNPWATWISFKCGDIFSASHQHVDQNSFSIFRMGDLAIKSGVYDSDGAWTDHNVNYYTRTISANTVLVYDPNETFGPWRALHPPKVANDGGQRADRGDNQEYRDAAEWLKFQERQETGDLLRYEHTPEYTYVLGDATNAYSRRKLTLFTRELVYLRPNYVVIFDRVHATHKEFAKKWLLHTLEEPLVEGRQTPVSEGESLFDGDVSIAVAGDGKLFTKTLLPEQHRLRKVGGRGVKDAWVFGENMALEPGTSKWGMDYGTWRLEVEPAIARKDDVFLHVLYPTDVTTTAMPDTVRVDSTAGDMRGAQIQEPEQQYVVLFHEPPGDVTADITYQVTGWTKSRHVLVDLEPATQVSDYQIAVTAASQGTLTVAISKAPGPGGGVLRGVQNVRKTGQGVLSFDVPAIRAGE